MKNHRISVIFKNVPPMFHTKIDLECDAVVFQLQHQNDVSRGKELEWNAVGKDSLPFKV